MRTSRLLALSLCLNLVLAGVLIRTSKVSPQAALSGDSKEPAIRNLPLGTRHSTPDTSRHLTAALIAVDESFRWSQLESADYRVYVRNLRGIGCPEATVRDIVIADVNEVFYVRVKELVETVQNRFWEMLANRNAFEKMVDDKHKELDGLEKERDNLLQELLGLGADHRLRREELTQIERLEQRKQFLDFLPPEKLERCLAVDAKFDGLRDALNNADPPLDSADLQARSKKLLEDQKSEFESLLSPEEQAEYKLRNSRFADLRFRLNGFDATDAELKEMVRTQEAVATVTQTNAPTQPNDALKGVLGAERFAQYERSLDNRFQEFYQVADRFELPTQKAVEGYEIRRAAEMMAQRVQSDKSATEDRRNEQLIAIRLETERSLAETLGQRAFEMYQTRSGQWLHGW